MATALKASIDVNVQSTKEMLSKIVKTEAFKKRGEKLNIDLSRITNYKINLIMASLETCVDIGKELNQVFYYEKIVYENKDDSVEVFASNTSAYVLLNLEVVECTGQFKKFKDEKNYETNPDFKNVVDRFKKMAKFTVKISQHDVNVG